MWHLAVNGGHKKLKENRKVSSGTFPYEIVRIKNKNASILKMVVTYVSI